MNGFLANGLGFPLPGTPAPGCFTKVPESSGWFRCDPSSPACYLPICQVRPGQNDLFLQPPLVAGRVIHYKTVLFSTVQNDLFLPAPQDADFQDFLSALFADAARRRGGSGQVSPSVSVARFTFIRLRERRHWLLNLPL